jgi:hypothetical protein
MTCCKSYLESHIRVGQSHLIFLNPHFGWLLQFCWFDEINAFLLLRGLGCSRNHQMCYDVLPKSAGFLQNSPGLLLKSPGFVGEPTHFSVGKSPVTLQLDVPHCTLSSHAQQRPRSRCHRPSQHLWGRWNRCLRSELPLPWRDQR